jgi:2-hydroxy-3-keto-5-methylthiopentenyl-1-phosphate phosphatase
LNKELNQVIFIKMKTTKLKIYSDFDGTITDKDVWMQIGDFFIKDRAAWEKLIRKFENLEIGARECFTKEVELIEGFDLKKFNDIIDEQKIDDSFINFFKYCNDKVIPFMILSEGMDYYVGRILEKNNINISYYANHCEFPDDYRKLKVSFPFSDSECTRCGCCKRNFILNMTADDEISVLIGDGFSDVCAAKYADIVFAKKSLASYCWKNNITYFEFQNFFDIQKKLEKLMEHNRTKQRQQAKLNRRDVFLCG